MTGEVINKDLTDSFIKKVKGKDLNYTKETEDIKKVLSKDYNYQELITYSKNKNDSNFGYNVTVPTSEGEGSIMIKSMGKLEISDNIYFNNVNTDVAEIGQDYMYIYLKIIIIQNSK